MTRARLHTVITLLLGTLITSGAAAACPQADEAAVAWLNKMVESMRQTSYQGVVTLQRGNDMQVMQVSRVTNGNASDEKLTQLNGQGARVMRDGHPLNCEHPGHKLLSVSRALEQGNCGIAERYSFAVAGRERVAGREAVKIRVRPLDIYRFGYTLSLDEETGLLLKTEMVAHDQRVLEKSQFANLSYQYQGGQTTAASVVHRARHPHPTEPSISAPVNRPWRVQWLPEGFSPTDTTAALSGRRTFTDGLAVFSVFLEDYEGDIRPGEGYVREGATTSYTRGGHLSGVAVLVTVIGEVPLNTARMVADSVRWEP